MMWFGNNGWGGWLMIAVMMVAFWGVVVLGLVVAVRAFNSPRLSDKLSAPSAAEQVLAGRFARGALSEEDYRQGLAALRETHGSW